MGFRGTNPSGAGGGGGSSSPASPYRSVVLADTPAFYLPGDDVVPHVGDVTADLLGGVTLGGPAIAPGLGGSIVIPDLPNTDATVTAVHVPNVPAINMAGHPVVEFWCFPDRDGGANTEHWVTLWMLNNTTYLGFYNDASHATLSNPRSDWYVGEPQIGDSSSDFSPSGVTPGGGPYHVVTYVGADLLIRTYINGALAHETDAGGALSVAAPAVTDDLVIGCSRGSGSQGFGVNYTGKDRFPGRISDFAVYYDGDTRDVPAMAAAHHAAGLVEAPKGVQEIPFSDGISVPDASIFRKKAGVLGVTGRLEGLGLPVLLDDVVLTTPAPSFDFTAIPGTYKHLRVLLNCRTDVAGNAVQTWLRFNGDTTAGHYLNANVGLYGGDGASAQLNQVDPSDRIFLGMGMGTLPGAGKVQAVEMTVLDYAGTVLGKGVLFSSAAYIDAPAGFSGGSAYVMASAINELTIFPDSGNFIAGSRCSLYGVN